MVFEWYYALIIIACYLLGSVNSAVLIARIRHVDIKKVGSGNPGTMNMIRSVGTVWGVITFLLDVLKGVLVALCGMWIDSKSMSGQSYLFIFSLALILGHAFPIFSHFKGGKGVANSIGIFLVAAPIATLIAFALFMLFLYFCSYGAVGSLLFVLGLSIYCGIKNACFPFALASICIICALIFFFHRKNIMRLIQGKENKLNLFGRKKFTVKTKNDDESKQSLEDKIVDNCSESTKNDSSQCDTNAVVNNDTSEIGKSDS